MAHRTHCDVVDSIFQVLCGDKVILESPVVGLVLSPTYECPCCHANRQQVITDIRRQNLLGEMNQEQEIAQRLAPKAIGRPK